MGTSKANNGPIGYSQPIQDWNVDNVSTDEDRNNTQSEPDPKTDDDNQLLGKWGDAKRSFSLFTKNPTKSNYKKFTASYKKASGGSKKLTKSSIGGRKGAVILLDFLNKISVDGFQDTLNNFNIGDIEKLQAEGAINKLSKIFSDIDGTDEGSCATSAAIETINKLYNDYIETPDLLDNLNVELITEYLHFYLSNYIFERISIDVSKALEDNKLTIQQVNAAEAHLKSYIEAEVQLNFDDSDFSTIDFNKQNSIVNKIFNDAYSLI